MANSASTAINVTSNTMTIIMVVLLVAVTLPAVVCELVNCIKPELRPCYCGKTTYDRQDVYAVNCSGTSLLKKNSLDALLNLPNETELLIFTGNSLPELPSNIFGVNRTMEKLRFLDLSNNGIREIKGKSFHHVSAVERLILNNNEIELNIGLHHPRIFSNFENLLELHLTDAFAEYGVSNITADLYEVFINSNLSRLAKLHLEQNKISSIVEPRVFCKLPRLLDLHLSNNELTAIDFDIKCLPHLRFIDLEGNLIRGLSDEQFSILDSVQSSNTSLVIDLSNNPFSCGCNIENLYSWLRITNVTVRNKDSIRCHQESPKNPLDPYADYRNDCPSPVRTTLVDGSHGGHKLIMLFVFCAVFAFLGAVLYVSRFGLKRLRPEFNTSSRKIHYTTIGKCEEQEIHV